MRAFIMPNLDKTNAVECTEQVIKKLVQFGIEPIMDLRYQAIFSLDICKFCDFYTGVFEANVVIAIGGDGTIIHSAKHAVAYDRPLLGINVGRLGYLAGLEMSELDRLSMLVSGGYKVEERMMLTCTHFSGDTNSEYLALNDIVISNGALSRMVELDIKAGDRHLTTYRADGVIFATPTGSTAYSLSAGGPIIEPALNCTSITPICPHALDARTIIISSEQMLSVHPSEQNLHPIYVTVDGEQGAKLSPTDHLEIRRSSKTVKLINLTDRGFYEVLGSKFNLRSAPAMRNNMGGDSL